MDLWITIIIIGAVTYTTRVIPLFWCRLKNPVTQPSWRDRLGPCLLVSMAVAVILPIFEAPHWPWRRTPPLVACWRQVDICGSGAIQVSPPF